MDTRKSTLLCSVARADATSNWEFVFWNLQLGWIPSGYSHIPIHPTATFIIALQCHRLTVNALRGTYLVSTVFSALSLAYYRATNPRLSLLLAIISARLQPGFGEHHV